MMRKIGILVVMTLGVAAVAWAGEMPSNAAMKALFEEMKSNMETEKSYREGKKIELKAVEAEVDKLRADAKAKGASEDPPAVAPLQMRRLAILEDVAQRDVMTAEKGVEFAQRKLTIARDNLDAFRAKKTEAEKSIKF